MDPSSLLGEIVTWDLRSAQVSYDLVKKSLVDSGLDESLAAELTPRSAFTRACRDLKKDRAIDKLRLENGVATFQFTHKAFTGSLIEFDFECAVELDTDTGKITCDANPELEKEAADLISVAMATRNAQDITRIVQKLFHNNADLYAIHRRGFAYFVPEEHRDFTNQVEKFLARLGGNLARFPVPKGTQSGNASVRDAVQLGLTALLDELNESVSQWGDTTKKKTMEKAQERLDQLLYKVDAYSEYLGAEQERLKQAMTQAKTDLAAKIEAIGAPVAA